MKVMVGACSKQLLPEEAIAEDCSKMVIAIQGQQQSSYLKASS
jgi:hypothetical protein